MAHLEQWKRIQMGGSERRGAERGGGSVVGGGGEIMGSILCVIFSMYRIKSYEPLYTQFVSAMMF